MRIFKRFLPFLAGFLIFVGINALLNYMLIPYQFTRMKIHRIETEDFDDLVLGSSHGSAAIDPAVIEEKTGRTCMSAAAGGQFPRDNYYLLLDAARKHKPGRVILEYDPLYWTVRDDFNRTARYQLDCMEMSPVKLDYMRTLCLSGDLRYVLMPWFLYDTSFRDIGRILAVKRSGAYRNYGNETFGEDGGQACLPNGFTPIPDTASGDRTIPGLSFLEGMEGYIEDNREYFEKTIRFCTDNGIEPVVVMTPVPESDRTANLDYYREASARMRELAETYGFLYLDFVNPEDDAERRVWADDEFSDGEGHMYESTARKFSALLGEALV